MQDHNLIKFVKVKPLGIKFTKLSLLYFPVTSALNRLLAANLFILHSHQKCNDLKWNLIHHVKFKIGNHTLPEFLWFIWQRTCWRWKSYGSFLRRSLYGQVGSNPGVVSPKHICISRKFKLDKSSCTVQPSSGFIKMMNVEDSRPQV